MSQCRFSCPDHFSEISVMAESKLPGRPRVSLVKQVKSTLRLYFSSRPSEWDTNWRQTWAWADAIRWKTPHFKKGAPPWPSPTEIASQYVLLCLTSMRDGTGLRLHYKAVEAMPTVVSLRLATTPSTPVPFALIESN